MNSQNSAPTSDPSATDWAWLAGLIDGEGHVTLLNDRHGEPGIPHVGVGMTHGPTLARVHALFGGSLNYKPARTPGRRDQWVVRWSCAAARRILAGVAPYAVTKREQGALVLSMPVRAPHGDRSRLDDATRAERRRIAAALRDDRWRQHTLPDPPTRHSRR